MIITYILFLLLLTIFTWGFAGRNFPFIAKNLLFDFIHMKPWFPGVLYSALVIIFFLFYFYFLINAHKKKIQRSHAWKLILWTVLILLPSFPAFWSHDIFNYMATARVAFFYKENPYVVMPIEIPNEPLLTFMHAANKVALYGPSWILSSVIPFMIGAGGIIRTMFAFKVFIAFFYLALCWLIWKLSRNVYTLIFFAMNPLVVIETLISSHNDVAMMFFAVLSFLLLQQRKQFVSVVSLIVSIFIKYSTLFLLPVYLYVLICIFYKKKVPWNKVWFFSAVSMYVIFFLSPIREEIYSWYLIWPLTFVSLITNLELLRYITLAFSFGLLFRVVPFFYTLNWGGSTPLIKKIVTFFPPSIAFLYYALRKKI